jgi:hypothetical protein
VLQLLDLVGRLGHWSYLIIFTAAALECSALLGLLVAGESPAASPGSRGPAEYRIMRIPHDVASEP